VIYTRSATEHALTSDGDVLHLAVVPAGAQLGALAASDAPAGAAVPAPEPQADATAAPEPAAPLPASAGERLSLVTFASGDFGTPEAPRLGPPIEGVAASRLTGVRVIGVGDETVIRVDGDGEFGYATFRLENPDRFVLDLDGVVNTSLRSTVPVDSNAVDQVRIGQFKPRPDPISRVVFDLRGFVPPRIERGPDGLTITFAGSPDTPAEAAPPVAAVVAEEMPPEELATPPASAQSMESQLAEPQSMEPQLAESQSMEPQSMEPQSSEPQSMEPQSSEPQLAQAQPISAQPAAVQPEAEALGRSVAPPAVQAPLPSEGRAARAERQAEAPLPAAGAAESPVAVARTNPPPAPPEAPIRVETRPPPPPPATEHAAVEVPTLTDVARFEAQQVQVKAPENPGDPESPIPPSFQSLVVSTQQKSYVGDPITMSLRDADLVETLRTFSKISDLNFVIQPGVQGSVTVELKSVPWDQALEQILKINNLGMDIDGTIVRIAPLTQLRAEAENRQKLERLRQQSVPLTTIVRRLSYADVGDVSTMLQNRNGQGRSGRSTGSVMSNRGSVQTDSRTNTLIIRELPEVINTVLAVIDVLDTPQPQVRIEARIVEATKTFSRTVGIQWSFTGEASNRLGNTTGLAFPNNITTSGGVNLLTGGNNGFLNLSLGNVLNSFTIDAQLLAAENEGLINVVSAPSVMTLSNREASIQSGIQIPLQTVANNTVTTQFVNATLQLSVTPHVTAEGTIQMSIKVQKKEPQTALLVPGATNAPIATRDASTTVIVRDGGTAVIGGIYTVTNNQSQGRVPGLANVPILKHLFRNRNRDNRNEELLIFVTPRIVQM